MVGNRGPLNVTIVQVGRGNGGGGDGGSDLLRLEPPSDLRPSPLSDTSTTLQSDNNDTLASGKQQNISLYITFVSTIADAIVLKASVIIIRMFHYFNAQILYYLLNVINYRQHNNV